ncbi:MAG: 50S ribosomal protein L9 [Myxococcota bacterium]|nr:50S ribosomal protein L9 [Myxococcota bacterium]
MNVILREDVPHLGEVGDLVTVKAGFARNYLLPRGLAVQANDRQMRRVEHEKRIIEVRVARERVGAEEEKAKLDALTLTIEKAAGENDKLFGSVTTMELEALLRHEGVTVDRRRIKLDDPIKTIGTHHVSVRLHRDVTATFKVSVVRREEEQ